MKKVIALVVVVLAFVAFTTAFGAEIKGSKIETNVKNTSVQTMGGLGAVQDVNVGGVNVKGSGKIKDSAIKTNVQNTSVKTMGGLGAKQDVNVGGVNVK